VRTKRTSYIGTMKDKRNMNLSENQEDKLALLRTLQGILYTTRHESLTNLLSKYE
jgi:hypothetical protein